GGGCARTSRRALFAAGRSPGPGRHGFVGEPVSVNYYSVAQKKVVGRGSRSPTDGRFSRVARALLRARPPPKPSTGGADASLDPHDARGRRRADPLPDHPRRRLVAGPSDREEHQAVATTSLRPGGSPTRRGGLGRPRSSGRRRT